MPDLEFVHENKTHEIPWDFQIQIDNPILVWFGFMVCQPFKVI